MIEQKFVERIAEEAGVKPEQVARTIPLFDKGATIPFVARYRKDVTGNLDEERLERIFERNAYFTALTNRRNAILENIEKQGALTDELRAKIDACFDQTLLEDLYAPFKKQRRTKASVAKEQGLDPLADFIWNQQLAEYTILDLAERLVDPAKSVLTPEEALLGAYHILAERVSLDADARAMIRNRILEEGKLVTAATKNATGQKTKFEAYYNHSEPLKEVPSHRLLAILRGLRMGFLRMDLVIDDDKMLEDLLAHFLKQPGSCFEDHLRVVITDAYKRLLRPSLENETVGIARAAADEEAIRVFRENATNLLLAPPAGQMVVMGLDPGLRTGCKLAVVDKQGTFLESATIFPTEPANDLEGAEQTLRALIEKHQVQGIAIGNGTGAREAARFVTGALKKIPDHKVFMVFVNEAGASVYSASKLAREEFPDMDVTIRGAVSIARRLQDPLAELVKIEPRSIGVGQYQHDVNQRRLREGLYRTVENCVNRIGVDLNTASVELLRYVSGIQMGTAQSIIEFRTTSGAFQSRTQLMEVSGIGEKTFEQCAGFLRVRNGEHPLDATGIHPEAYPVVESMAGAFGVPVADLIGNHKMLDSADLTPFVNETVGLIALNDIRQELLQPGRDPRAVFKVPRFIDGVYDVQDLEEGMEAEGVVTNITDFGAFVDIGVHQDGLIHLSELSNRYVRDPREIIKVGDIVRVKVIKVDKEIRRVSLSRKALLTAPPKRSHQRKPASQEAQEGQDKAAPRHDGRRRPPRQDAAPAGVEGRETAHRRPSREGDAPPRERSQRSGGKPPHRDDRRQDRKPARKHDAVPAAQKKESSDLMNTQLAEQLAALRDKFSR